MIAEGTYTATCISAELTETKSGNAQVVLTLELADEAKEIVTYYGSFSETRFPPQTWSRPGDPTCPADNTIRALEACGFHDPKSDIVASIEAGPAVGNSVRCKVVHDTYNGKTSLKVKSIFTPGSSGASVNRLSADKARALAERLRGHKPMVNEGDEIPF